MGDAESDGKEAGGVLGFGIWVAGVGTGESGSKAQWF